MSGLTASFPLLSGHNEEKRTGASPNVNGRELSLLPHNNLQLVSATCWELSDSFAVICVWGMCVCVRSVCVTDMCVKGVMCACVRGHGMGICMHSDVCGMWGVYMCAVWRRGEYYTEFIVLPSQFEHNHPLGSINTHFLNSSLQEDCLYYIRESHMTEQLALSQVSFVLYWGTAM